MQQTIRFDILLYIHSILTTLSLTTHRNTLPVKGMYLYLKRFLSGYMVMYVLDS